MKEHTFALPHGFRTKAELTGFANHAITLPKRLPWEKSEILLKKRSSLSRLSNLNGCAKIRAYYL
jgi:hypothetical protein